MLRTRFLSVAFLAFTVPVSAKNSRNTLAAMTLTLFAKLRLMWRRLEQKILTGLELAQALLMLALK